MRQHLITSTDEGPFKVGDVVYLRFRVSRWERVKRWFTRVVLRRKPDPGHCIVRSISTSRLLLVRDRQGLLTGVSVGYQAELEDDDGPASA